MVVFEYNTMYIDGRKFGKLYKSVSSRKGMYIVILFVAIMYLSVLTDLWST